MYFAGYPALVPDIRQSGHFWFLLHLLHNTLKIRKMIILN